MESKILKLLPPELHQQFLDSVASGCSSWEFSKLTTPLMLEVRKAVNEGYNLVHEYKGDVFVLTSACFGSQPVADNAVVMSQMITKTEHNNWGLGGAVEYNDTYPD
jgi:hypothetical protein